MKWLRSHRKQGIVILVVIVLAVILVVSFLSAGTDTWFGRAAESVMQTVQKPFSAAGNGVQKALYRVTHSKELEEENALLKEKVSSLEAELRNSKIVENDLEKLENLRDFLQDNELTDYEVVTTRVTALDRSNWFSAITIGAGTKDGVRKNDIVVSADGLVGRVVEVTASGAKVLCAIHDSQNVSFRILRDLDILGVAKGDGEGNLSGYLLSTEALMKVGDVCVTSGMGLYPEGIPVGTVTTRHQDEDSRLIYVTIEPFVDFSKLETVSVIKMNGASE